MTEKSEAIKLDHYINLIYKHRWLIIIPFCLCMIVGIYLSIMLPKKYEAKSLILARPQQLSKDYVSDIETASPEFRVNTIAKKILSHSNLKKIIDEFNLFSNPDQQDMDINMKIGDVLEEIEIEREESMKYRDSYVFSISFQWPNPQQAALVANRLAYLFINQDLRERESEAVETTQFLDEQLRPMGEQLKEFENRLSQYRKRYMGELPEQLESNLRILDTLQRELGVREARLRDEKNRLALLEIDIQVERELLSGGAIISATGEEMTLLQLKNKLITLKASYTDQHPDVIQLKAMIADMEAKLKSGGKPAEETNPSTNLTEEQLMTSQKISGLIRQQNEIKLIIIDLEQDIQRTKNEIWAYQRRIDNTPKREEELKSLNRDYQDMRESYSSLLDRKLEAEVAVSMEKKQKGEQFSIVQSAHVPLSPESPNIKAIFTFAVMGAFSIGSGLLFLLDYFDTSLKDPVEFESSLGVTVLATVPKVYTKKDLLLKRLNKVLTGFSLTLAACLLAGFAVLAILGVDPTIKIVQNLPELWAELWANDNLLSK